MTPEERFIKIENSLQAVIEMQGRHETVLEKRSAMIDKQNAGIRDLITVSRTLLDTAAAHNGLLAGLAEAQRQTAEAQKQRAEEQKRTEEAQKRTDQSLNALIETVRGHEGKIDILIDIVDRLVRREDRPS